MSKDIRSNSKTIKSKAELIEWFQAACTPADKLLMGIEHEKAPFYLDTGEPVSYKGKGNRPGLQDFLKKMAAEGKWKAGFEADNIIDLKSKTGGMNWSLEPSGQLETGGAPVKNAHETADETDIVIEEALEVAESLGMGLLAMGYYPTLSGKDMPFMPKSRYRALRDYVKERKFLHGVDGMCCTSTVQVNLGYESEEDMVKKLRVALALQPIASALFANSPFKEGEPSGYQSYRSHIIHNYLGGRYGFMLPMAFEEGFGFESFVDYAMNEVPLMWVYKDGDFVDVKGATFADFMEGKIEALPGQKATFADWENHLNTIWPEVRVRRFLEMRGADSGSPEMIKALPAFWAGLLYDKEALNSAYEMIRYWTAEDREYLRKETPKTGLQTPFMNGEITVQDLAKNCLALSDAGLKRRAIKDKKGQDESIYLKPLHEIAETGKNNAQKTLENFHGPWKGDLKRVFQERAYKKTGVPTKKKTLRSLLSLARFKSTSRNKKFGS